MPTDVSSITREHIEAFLVDVIERRSPATAEARYRGLRGFFSGARPKARSLRRPMAKMQPPRFPSSQSTCRPSRICRSSWVAAATTSRADATRPIIRLFSDSGLRLAELTGLRLADVDSSAGMVGVTGKGGRFRTASFGQKTAKSIDRYLRVRRGHIRAESDRLWLGLKGPMTGSGVRQMLWRDPRRPASRGCIHISSGTTSHIAGWPVVDRVRSDGARRVAHRTMVTRYAASTRAERARDAHKRFSPGDRL